MNRVAVIENVRSGLAQIWAHKMRSMLTLTGVVFGVLSINAMFSLVGGIRQSIAEGFEAVGLENVVFVTPRWVPREEQNAYTHASRGLTPEDAQAINRAELGALAVPMTSFNQTVQVPGGEQVSVQVTGTYGDFFDMRNLKVGVGRTLLPADEFAEAPVAVIGPKIAADLFPKREALGEVIALGNIAVTVVGILDPLEMPPGTHMGGLDTQGNTVYIPVSTARRYYTGTRLPVALALDVESPDELSSVIRSAETLLTRRHRGVMDFEIENVAQELLEARDQIDELMGNMNIVLGCIAGAALLVGGIGILSVLLIAIQERLFEIGLRKSLGARDDEILLQFLVESVVLSGVGALLGSLGAWVFVLGYSSQVPTGLHLSLGGLGLSFAFAMGIAVIFGFYPAWLASRLTPVDALRSA